eukprot:s2762_g4.t4
MDRSGRNKKKPLAGCQVLLEYPAFGKLSSRDVQGRSPLERAIREGRLQTSRFLKRKSLPPEPVINDDGLVIAVEEQEDVEPIEEGEEQENEEQEEQEEEEEEEEVEQLPVAEVHCSPAPALQKGVGFMASLKETKQVGFMASLKETDEAEPEEDTPQVAEQETLRFSHADQDELERKPEVQVRTDEVTSPARSVEEKGDVTDARDALKVIERAEIAGPSHVGQMDAGEAKSPKTLALKEKADMMALTTRTLEVVEPVERAERESLHNQVEMDTGEVVERAQIAPNYAVSDGPAHFQVEQMDTREVSDQHTGGDGGSMANRVQMVDTPQAFANADPAKAKRKLANKFNVAEEPRMLVVSRVFGGQEEIDLRQVKLHPRSKHFLSEGRTPLHRAAMLGRFEVTLALLQGVVNVNAKDMLHLVGGGHKDICRALLKYPPMDLVAVDALGCNALHCAAARGHVEICQLILQQSLLGIHGTFQTLVQQTNIWGQVPLDVSTGSAREVLQSGAEKRRAVFCDVHQAPRHQENFSRSLQDLTSSATFSDQILNDLDQILVIPAVCDVLAQPTPSVVMGSGRQLQVPD